MPKNFNKYIVDFHQYWFQFSDQLELSFQKSEKIYQILLTAYTEPQRHYHTVQHIVECIALFQQVKSDIRKPELVEMAIWFHDVIYDPRAKNNEFKSAEMMKDVCFGIFDLNEIETIYEWILATQKHEATHDNDLCYLLDIDLSILSASKNRFLEYEIQIRNEYAFVEHKMYKQKRVEVLQYFYMMDSIYKTSFFREMSEVKAKDNLIKYIHNETLKKAK